MCPRGTSCPRANCLGGESALGQVVSGDILRGGQPALLHRPITLAHADDIWVLASSIAKSQPIPRSLLKNGKHNSNNLDVWRNSAKCQSLVQESVSWLANDAILPTSQSLTPSDNHMPYDSSSEPATNTTTSYVLPAANDIGIQLLMKDINALKDDI